MPSSRYARELYRELLHRGYPASFCQVIANELDSDISARRMLGYLAYYDDVSLSAEEIADEMLAIQSDRNVWIQKKTMERTQAAWNEQMRRGFEE